MPSENDKVTSEQDQVAGEQDQATSDEEKLYLRFHGRIIDSLGIQMYQSPVAAVAELIANAWDADASQVKVQLPSSLSGQPGIIVQDNGVGMTFAECQKFYLNVGRDRRAEDSSDASPGGRPVLGRKGIGKFAGFGIAELLEIDTTSSRTGERTIFQLDLRDLRSDAYVGTAQKEVPIILKEDASEAREALKGTRVTMRRLKLSRRPSLKRFRRSMARRFLINQVADEFQILINDKRVPDDNALTGVEFDFPTDYKQGELPAGLRIKNRVGQEKIGEDEISWRIRFTKEPIGTEELRGISVFCGIKLAQSPFFFNLSGGLSGQHGQQYVSGQVQADYLDRLSADVITTERQRINWELSACRPLEEWGKERVKSLLSIWKARRAEEKLQQIENKVAPFSARLEKLNSTEKRTVRSALRKVAAIEALSDDQFADLSNGILTAWEGGRLRQLIEDVSNVEDMDEAVLLSLLAEAQVLNALHVAEAVKAKVDIVEGLRRRITNKDLENAVRDYIAGNPWLLSPEWETFKVEISVKSLLTEAAAEAKLDTYDDGANKRIDLALAAGRQLLVVEFMRPGLTVDREHVNRYQEYVDIVRDRIAASTAHRFDIVSGLLVADKLNRKPGMEGVLTRLAGDDMEAIDWEGLLGKARAQWKDFLDVLVARAPKDDRLAGLPTNEDVQHADGQTVDAS